MKNDLFLFALLMVACTSWGNSLASSQTTQSGLLSATSTTVSTTNYYFAKPNELTIIVNIVGYVQRPGRYEISNSIDLVNAIALAGGASPDGNLSDVKITRFSETEGRLRMRETTVNLEDLTRVNPADLRLQPGDLIQVDKSGWASFRDAMGMIVPAAIITGAVAQMIYATKR